ncbi:MAG: type II toxin-antitoxin system VapC family toxin [Deltaproteobacteria bacterium]|nr:type II toxin-antitoxin system VapC family toxin [Deltaproteobacteria bacterium]
MILDANVVLAQFDAADVFHDAATALTKRLERDRDRVVVLDCVANEVLSVLARRLRERRRDAEVAASLKALRAALPAEIASAYSLLPGCFDEVVDDMIRSNGRRNFHDALIVVYARRHAIPVIASFDRDFDGVSGLLRVAG